MLKPSPSRIAFSLLGWFCIILVVAWISGSTGKICNEAQTTHEQCTTYNLAPFILIQIREFLHSIENIITALATIAIACFTWTLYKSSEKMWAVTEIAAKASQKSADVAENALLAANNPIITITELELRDANEFFDKPHIHWGLRNSGPGTGVVHTMHTRTAIAIATPEGIKVFRSKEKIQWGSSIESKTTAPGFSITTPMLQTQIAEIRAGVATLTFLIQTDGQNIFKDRFSVLFSFGFDHASGGFNRMGAQGTPETNDAK
jgi:hypothetical protein